MKDVQNITRVHLVARNVFISVKITKRSQNLVHVSTAHLTREPVQIRQLVLQLLVEVIKFFNSMDYAKIVRNTIL